MKNDIQVFENLKVKEENLRTNERLRGKGDG